MYRNVVLTLLLVAATAIAIELARSKPPLRSLDSPVPTPDAARAILEKRIPDLQLHDITVGRAIEKIRQITGVPIAVDWKTIQTKRDQKVDIHFHDVAMGDAIQFLLALYTGGSMDGPSAADFSVVDGTLFIGPTSGYGAPTFPDGSLTLRIYDISDLLTDQYWGYHTTLQLPSSQPLTSKTIEKLWDSHITDAQADELAAIVQNCGGMNNYCPYYGGDPAIRVSGTRLLVTQTAYGQMQVQALLSRLRAARHARN